jgi:hypothetical protein
MPEDARQLTCEEFQRNLCRLLAADEPIEEHQHYKACVVCRSLVRSFEKMIENTRDDPSASDNRQSDDWSEST